MISFVQLTDKHGRGFLIGVWHIETIVPLRNGIANKKTVVFLFSGRKISVQEEKSVIEERIIEARKRYEY